VSVSEEDTVEGYHVLVGGGSGPDAMLARELFRDVKAEDCPPLVERMLRTYMAERASGDETFFLFTKRHDDAALQSVFAECRP
jgi:ferredoxin-nitrite reductase